MRKIITALALAGASFVAAATGSYDGVYQTSGSSGYLVVMQNGSTLGVAAMGQITNSSSVRYGNSSNGTVSPSQVNIWEVYTGSISGNTATVSGTSDYSACTTTARITFDGAGNLTLQPTSATPTTLGTTSAYNCWPAGSGTARTFTKVF